jgi:hypothetical protein
VKKVLSEDEPAVQTFVFFETTHVLAYTTKSSSQEEHLAVAS